MHLTPAYRAPYTRLHPFYPCRYALSRGALHALSDFHAREWPAYLRTVDARTYGGEDAAVAYVLKEASNASVMSYAPALPSRCGPAPSRTVSHSFAPPCIPSQPLAPALHPPCTPSTPPPQVLNCGSFYQMRPDMYVSQLPHQTDYIRWPLSPTPVSFHTFKHPGWLSQFHRCALYRPDGAPRCFLPDVAALLGGGCAAADGAPLSAGACAAAGARLALPPRLAAAADGAADEVAGACPALQSCEQCIAHEPPPPPFDRGVRCVWCPTLGACRAYTKGSGVKGFPCPSATRPGGGYPGGSSCKAAGHPAHATGAPQVSWSREL